MKKNFNVGFPVVQLNHKIKLCQNELNNPYLSFEAKTPQSFNPLQLKSLHEKVRRRKP